MIGRKGVRDALLAAMLFGMSAPVAKILVGNLAPHNYWPVSFILGSESVSRLGIC